MSFLKNYKHRERQYYHKKNPYKIAITKFGSI